jgi:hypothetical protein
MKEWKIQKWPVYIIQSRIYERRLWNYTPNRWTLSVCHRLTHMKRYTDQYHVGILLSIRLVALNNHANGGQLPSLWIKLRFLRYETKWKKNVNTEVKQSSSNQRNEKNKKLDHVHSPICGPIHMLYWAESNRQTITFRAVRPISNYRWEHRI